MARRTFRLFAESTVAADRATVWAHASTMAGINAELRPLHMSSPPGSVLTDATPMGVVLFRSVISLARIVPLDLHSLRLLSLTPGEGFHEESTSWTEETWVHKRMLSDVDGGTRIVDDVIFTPRLPLLAPVLAATVRSTFARRHRYLRSHFHGDGPVLTCVPM